MIMTTRRILTLAVLLAMTAGFSGCGDIKVKDLDLSENTEETDMVFDQIQNNREIFEAFLVRVMDNPDNMRWIMENGRFVRYMYLDDNMEYIIDHNENMDEFIVVNVGNMLERDSTFMQEWKSELEDEQ